MARVQWFAGRAAALGLLAACIPAVGTRAWFDGEQQGILRRASFDLSCPAQELQASPVGTTRRDMPEGDYSTVGIAGCGRKATYIHHDGAWVLNNASVRDGTSSTGKSLLADIKALSERIVIGPRSGEGSGLGDALVTREGQAVWPPRGEACGPLVSCCTARSSKDRTFALMCQLAVARDASCVRALETVQAIATELGAPLLPECATR
jgi:hypothetical protein